MSTAEKLSECAEALRKIAERERDETVALLCRTLAIAYETAAAQRSQVLRRLQ